METDGKTETKNANLSPGIENDISSNKVVRLWITSTINYR